MKTEHITLKDGSECNADAFDFEDYKALLKIFGQWMEINKELKDLEGRDANIPDILSEALFCYYFDSVRTNGVAGSYDCVNRETKKGIQVKSCSIDPDCTSFGPRTNWDDLYFIDFAPHGIVDGWINFYKIDKKLDDIIVNQKKNETFHDQQEQGRRPRFSVKKKIIEPEHLKPIKTINLNDEIRKYISEDLD